eukprot:m.73592 g.73592  ORF g.73592 m.73592 type:complete len:103 (-) comp50304_c0_seq7:665-973(-)
MVRRESSAVWRFRFSISNCSETTDWVESNSINGSFHCTLTRQSTSQRFALGTSFEKDGYFGLLLLPSVVKRSFSILIFDEFACSREKEFQNTFLMPAVGSVH